MTDYAAHWVSLMKAKGTEGVDLVASMTEEAINNFLAKHFALDKIHYVKTVEKSFNDGTQIRTFSLEIEVGSALKIDFPPFSNAPVFAASADWNEVDHIEAKERSRLVTPNIRITCDSLKFKLVWDNLTPPPATHKWEPTPIRLVAEAYMWLDYVDGRHRLMLEPTRIKFDPATPIKQLPATTDCEKKFNDLLVIALNVAAYEYGPSLVRAIEIPALNVQGMPIYPALLDLSSDMISIGAGIDQPSLERKVTTALQPLVAQYMGLFEEDVRRMELAGASFGPDGRVAGKALSRSQIQEHLRKHMSGSSAFVARVMKSSESRYTELTGSRAVAKSKAAAAVTEGIAVGFDEYIVDTLLTRFFDKREEGSYESSFAGTIKGGVRWWFRVSNPDAEFKNNEVVGSTDLDVGGAIFACVKKFWKCSSSWECSELSLGVSGRPSIQLLTSNIDQGIALRARLGGNLTFSNSLPFPFREVINAVGNIVIQAIIDLVNLVLSLIVVVIVAVEIKIPDVKTGLKLSGFSRFMFERDASKPVALPGNKPRAKAAGYTRRHRARGTMQTGDRTPASTAPCTAST